MSRDMTPPASVPPLGAMPPGPGASRQAITLERIADALDDITYYMWAGLVTRIPNLPFPQELKDRRRPPEEGNESRE
jgi:hypothetical protein